MDIQLSDVTVHMDEALDKAGRGRIEEKLRAIDGVISVHNPDDKPHLAVIGFVPAKTTTDAILGTVRAAGIRAELVGL